MLALVTSLVAAPPSAILATPDIFGDRVVFSAEGDLWLGSVTAGSASRLTSSPGREINPKFSPDGKTIAFSGQYDSATADVYTIATDGGEPTRLTWDRSPAIVQDWSPDGKSVLFRSGRTTTKGYGNRLFTVPATGGIVRPVAVPQGEFATYLPDGRLAYVPTSREWMNWFRYEGGAADAIWLADLKGGFRKLTNNSTVDTTPVWGGDALYYVSEKTGTANLWRLDPRANQQSIVTRNVENEIRYPGSDGKRVIFEAGPTLAIYDPGTKVSQPLSFRLIGDRIHTRPQLVPIAPSVTAAAPGPSGKRVAVLARGQLVSIAAENGENRVLDGTAGARASLAAWSRDGKSIAYVTDRTGENEIWIVGADGGAPKQLTKEVKANFISLRWSPDGKSIAAQDRNGRTLLVDAASGNVALVYEAEFVGSYDSGPAWLSFSPDSRFLGFAVNQPNFTSQAMIFDTQKKVAAPLSPEGMFASCPTFSPDGKYVAYLAERRIEPAVLNFTQRFSVAQTTRVTIAGLDPKAASPFLPKLDDEGQPTAEPVKKTDSSTLTLEGIQDRVFDSPIPSGEYSQLNWIDGQLLLVQADTPATIAGGIPRRLVAFDIGSKKVSELATDIAAVDISGDESKILVSKDEALSLVDAKSGVGKPVSVVGFVRTQPESEWRQILRETWRLGRDFFYDPALHGVDWNAVWRKYEARLPMVGARSDLAQLQKSMLSELNTGHCYVNDPSPRRAPVSMGYLGADFESAPDGARISKILRADAFSPGQGSPLSAPDVAIRAGDVITQIDGDRVAADREIQSYLEGKGGKYVELIVKRGPDTRKVVVRALPRENVLRYQDWVEGRKAYVSKAGGAGFGYMHIPDMVQGGATEFLKSQMANGQKDAVVVDFRGNTGGFVSSILLESFAAKRYASFNVRAGGPWTREAWAFRGHLAALCDEENFSDGELVIEGWKNLKIGPVVGKRTGGGEVGSGGGFLMIDGGKVFVPNYGAFVDGKWIIEGYGATPTIEVDQDPAAVMAGKDPQIDRAIAELKAWLKREPIKDPKVPVFPKKLKGSRGG